MTDVWSNDPDRTTRRETPVPAAEAALGRPLTDTPTRMRNTARRLVVDEGWTQQSATWYIADFYGVPEREAQVAVLDATHPGGFQAWMGLEGTA